MSRYVAQHKLERAERHHVSTTSEPIRCKSCNLLFTADSYRDHLMDCARKPTSAPHRLNPSSRKKAIDESIRDMVKASPKIKSSKKKEATDKYLGVPVISL